MPLPNTRSKAIPTKGPLSTPTQLNSPAPKPLASDNAALTLKVLEEHLTKHTDLLRHSLMEEISMFRNEIILKIEEIKDAWMQRFDELNVNMSTLTERITKLEEHTNAVSHAHNAEVLALRQQINALERKEVVGDAVLFGIPELPDENLKHLFNRLCHTIDCKPPPLKNIFRARRRINSNTTVLTTPSSIVLKFNSFQDRNAVLKAASNYRKLNNRELSLRDLGLELDNSCYLNESVTKHTRLLLQSAITLKRKKQLFSAYTKFGSLYVKKFATGKSFLIESADDLHAAVALY